MMGKVASWSTVLIIANALNSYPCDSAIENHSMFETTKETILNPVQSIIHAVYFISTDNINGYFKMKNLR